MVSGKVTKEKMNRELYKTNIEEAMKESLEENKIQAVYNFPIRCKYGYVLDFAIPDLKIDIECDGEVWHKLGNKRDNKRNWVLRKMGWKILRFRGKDILENVNSCIEEIKFNIIERGSKEDGKI